MNKAKLKQAIKKAEKDMDYRIEFYCGEVLTGLIYGGDPVECGYNIEKKYDNIYCIYFNYEQNVAICFDRFELVSI